MKFRLTGFPVFRSPDSYENAVTHLTEVLVSQRGIVAVYRLGSVSNPGISDLDVIAVFADSARSRLDPLGALPVAERALFTHPVFGISERHFVRNLAFGGYRGYTRVAGKEIRGVRSFAGGPPPRLLETQLALEFLLANALARTLDRFTGVLNVRGLLLSAKAVHLDLGLLGSDDPALMSSVETVSAWREKWFSHPPSEAAFCSWFLEYLAALRRFLADMLERQPLAVPAVHRYVYSRGIVLKDGVPFEIRRRRVPFPRTILPPGRLGKRIAKLAHRLVCRVPMHGTTDPFLAERFEFYRDLDAAHRDHFPKFNILANPVVHRLTRAR